MTKLFNSDSDIQKKKQDHHRHWLSDIISIYVNDTHARNIIQQTIQAHVYIHQNTFSHGRDNQT